MQRPAIDARRRPELALELVELARRYLPDWTASADDPGRAVLEIFAHLMEVLTSRADRIPDNHRLRFLELLGVQFLPARPARVAVQFGVVQGTQAPVLVPADTQVTAESGGETLPFES